LNSYDVKYKIVLSKIIIPTHIETTQKFLSVAEYFNLNGLNNKIINDDTHSVQNRIVAISRAFPKAINKTSSLLDRIRKRKACKNVTIKAIVQPIFLLYNKKNPAKIAVRGNKKVRW